LAINVLFALGLVVSYSAFMISPEKIWAIALFGLTYPLWVLANLLFIPVWLILKMRYSLMSLLVLAAGIPVHARQAAWGTPQMSGDEGTVKIMSYNVQLFGLYNWKDNKKHRNEMFRFLRKEDPDIACFQEYFYEETDYFETTDTLVDILDAPHVHFEPASSLHGTHHWGVATFSRYPIIKRDKIKFERSKGNICLITDIKKGRDTVRIFNVHFESNHLETDKIDRLAQGDSTARIIALDMFRALRKSYKRRAVQVEKVSKAISESPYPVIVCGDFNDTPVSYTYAKISHGLEDAFLYSGRGLGFTYAGKIPFLRIDYILHDKRIRSSGFRVVNEKKLSDHYPVECYMQFPREADTK
jgi:endonuclease/exonuclease/phosphatase family metal-dependent hydrolase